jgi:hypothetical protein
MSLELDQKTEVLRGNNNSHRSRFLKWSSPLLVSMVLLSACASRDITPVKSTEPISTRPVPPQRGIPPEPVVDPTLPRYTNKGALLPPGYAQVTSKVYDPSRQDIITTVRNDPSEDSLPPNYRRNHPPRRIESTTVRQTRERFFVAVEYCVDSQDRDIANRPFLFCEETNREVSAQTYSSVAQGQVVPEGLFIGQPKVMGGSRRRIMRL